MRNDPHSPADSVIDQLYKAGERAEPGPDLDQHVLRAAHAEIASFAKFTPLKQPWWRSWLPATTAIAAGLIGISVMLQVMHEQGNDKVDMLGSTERIAASSPSQPSVSNSVPRPTASSPPATQVAKVADTSALAKPESITSVTQSHEQSVAAGAIARRVETTDESPQLSNRTGAAPSVAAPPSTIAESIGIQRSNNADTAVQAMESRAKTSPIDPRQVAEPTTPTAWLTKIRELIAQGRHDEATKNLVRFKERYPAIELPADLDALVKATR